MLGRVLMALGATDSVAASIGDQVLAVSVNAPTVAEVGLRLLSNGQMQILSLIHI